MLKVFSEVNYLRLEKSQFSLLWRSLSVDNTYLIATNLRDTNVYNGKH
jgi:hypothetical protein